MDNAKTKGRVSVIGQWHLGAINAACLSSLGYIVTGIDANQETISNLKKNVPPLYEPGLAELIAESVKKGTLSFTTDFKAGLAKSEFVIIAIDTPLKEDNSSDLQPIIQSIEKSIPYLQNNCLLIISSQVPVGSCAMIRELIRKKSPGLDFGIACVPENLQLGKAISGYKSPDLLVIGADNEKDAAKAEQFYWFVESNKVKVDLKTAEVIKLAINSFMATEVSYGNELGNICDELGVDELRVADALRLDPRVGAKAQVRAGLGFSGGTVARDVIVLQKIGREKGVKTTLLDAVMAVNNDQNHMVIQKLESQFGSIKGLRIGVLGLTYKPNTSAIRHSVAIKIIRELVQKGASVKAYDPKAKYKKSDINVDFTRCNNADLVAESSDALLTLTAWPEFRELDFAKLRGKMSKPIVIDAINLLDAGAMAKLGFSYFGSGRGKSAKTPEKQEFAHKTEVKRRAQVSLKDKVAIITGSGRGLGRAIAIALAKEGAKLVLMSRTGRELKSVAKETGLPGSRIATFTGSISNEKDVRGMVDLAVSKFGAVDILINNAGVIGPIGATEKIDIREWINNINTNIIGTFMCTRMVLPILMKKKHGKIINTAGSGEKPLPNFSAYASSKSAIIRFTETLAEELKPYNIDVNAIAPGSINTKMTEEIFTQTKRIKDKSAEKYEKVLKTGGTPLELPASLAVFLSSSASDGITGKLISAMHDDWKDFEGRKDELATTEIYTMRRIAPDMFERFKLQKPKK